MPRVIKVVDTCLKKEGTFLDAKDIRRDISQYVFGDSIPDELNRILNECPDDEINKGDILLIPEDSDGHYDMNDPPEGSYHILFHPSKISTDILQCDDCGIVIDRNLDGGEPNSLGYIEEWALKSDENLTICNSCMEADREYTQCAVQAAGTEEYDRMSFGNYWAHSLHDVYPYSDELEEFCTHLKCNWESTSAWRGYNNVDIKDNKYIRVSSGWTSGWAGNDVPRKCDFNDLMEKLITDCRDDKICSSIGLKDDELNFTIFICTAPTSNIFSIAVDIYIHKDDLDDFKKWLKHHDTDEEDIEFQLG